MKQFFILTLFALLSLQAAIFADNSSGANARLDLPDTEMSIEQLFKTIHQQTGMAVIYNVKDVRFLKKVKVTLPQPTVKQALDEVLNPKHVSYVIDKNSIIIKQITNSVSGTVRDELTGEPLVGASIFDKNSSTGVVTGLEGEYTIYAKKGSTLTVSYLGYKPAQHKVSDSETINFALTPDTKTFDDVVVTGYKVIDKRASTSAITSIKAEDIMRPDALSIDQMLEGQVPDLMFMSNSGESGAAPKIRIRGTSSIIGNREPLWVVDGIVVKDPVPISPDELNAPDYVNPVSYTPPEPTRRS